MQFESLGYGSRTRQKLIQNHFIFLYLLFVSSYNKKLINVRAHFPAILVSVPSLPGTGSEMLFRAGNSRLP
jgi:hypothetical protein